jgi:glutamyl-tRNA synthetase
VVVDDATMGITEVVRGGDLILSTARQLLLYKALKHMWNRMIPNTLSSSDTTALVATSSTDFSHEADSLDAIMNRPHTFDPPAFFHCPLVRDAAGKRMAKRDGSTTLRGLRMGAQNPSNISSSSNIVGKVAVCSDATSDDAALPKTVTPADLMEKYFDTSMVLVLL